MTYIKTLIILTGLALLTACAGGVAINSTVINNGGDDLCEANPFAPNCTPTPAQEATFCGDDGRPTDTKTDDCTPVVIRECDANVFDDLCPKDPTPTEAKDFCDDDTKTTDTKTNDCAPTVMRVCTNGDIFDDFCTGLPDTDTMRANACQTHGTDAGGNDSCATRLASSCTITDPFAYKGCKDVAGIAGVRMMYCQTPATAWDGECTETTHGAVGATRVTACQMFGTGMGGDDSCATSLASSCTITDPFAHAGCDDVTNINADIRTPYCQTPATAWDAECMDTTHGTVSATRLTACQMFGTDTDTGGHATCAPSLASFCTIADPFAYTGCNNVVGIAGVRMMYCETPATAWDAECMDTTHGAVDVTRVMACQMFGTNTNMGGDDSCATSLTSSCTITDPFIYPGCDNVANINADIRTPYCQTPATAWDGECMDTTHGTVSATRVTACQMFGTDTGGDNSCATSLAPSCTITDPFIYPGCDNVANIDSEVRTPYCQTPATAWDEECMDGMHGTVNTTRVTACQMFGTKTNMGGDNSCATSLAPSCTITDPFIYPGCDNVANINADIRTPYCQAPATAWDAECMETTHGTVDATRVTACQMFGTDTNMGGDNSCATSLAPSCTITDPFIYPGCNNVAGIAGVRVMYCQTPATAWDGECMETTHGTVTMARVTACQMFGTDTGGDNSCATSLAPSCTITDPFAYTGCNNVAGIAEVRVMYCETLTTAWDAECRQTIHGDVTIKRGDACLKFGTNTGMGGHVSCVGNTLAESSCASNPFDPLKPGCAILTKFEMIVRTYCMNNHLAGCPTATHAAWVASFPENAPLRASNLAPAAGNKFVEGLEAGLNRSGFTPGTLVEDGFNFENATYNDIGFGGNATEGVAFQYGVIDGTRYFYAGLLSGTDLGAPLTAVTTDATWYGRIVILQRKPWYLTPEGKIYGDIDLTVNYDGNNNGTIRGVYGEYTVNGTFDSKGIMGGNVTRSKIHTYTRMTFIGDTTATEPTTYSFQRSIVGPLTGLVGQTEAVGVFIGQDFTNYDDRPRQLDANQNNFKHRAMGAGFAGGFIARSTQPTN